ncbi:DNA/RNA nuclease SfsA [Anaerofustis sp.]|uniref:DNA/RNA nuclease SfsA n=1 Tax=Anaerofustis sp. TaxID=1872517 RepID=UPI0025BEBC7B|nr:DNA/RNA nuclease SfsA [Anaerofustis sp.]
MRYNNIVKADFKKRINRFVAECDIKGENIKVHVKNTGRCKELLKENAFVYLQKSDNPNRKTAYDLISVYKGKELFNMDSQVPNRLVKEAIENGNIKLEGFDEDMIIKPETKYGNSRLDFFIQNKNRKAYVEVKGVTLEENGIAMFPDAPTVRGIKHIRDLIDALKEGNDAYLIFVIQFRGSKYFTPNPSHKDFIEALKDAKNSGVNILAFECFVSMDEVKVVHEIEVKL